MKTQKKKLPRKCLILYIAAGILCAGSLLVAQWHISGISKRSDIRSNGQKTTGMATSRSEVRFPSIEGEITGKPLIGPQQGTLTRYDSVVVYYDKSNPSQFILDQNESAYNATMWIVVAKLGVVSLVLFALGYRYQRKENSVVKV